MRIAIEAKFKGWGGMYFSWLVKLQNGCIRRIRLMNYYNYLRYIIAVSVQYMLYLYSSFNRKGVYMAGKVLVAYYSYSGNTKSVAEKIHSIVGGDLFEIKTVQKYPANYNEVINLAKKEKAENYKPQLVEMPDISAYDKIYLGSPVWWYTFATPIKSFLAGADFSGKVIIPFCTHGGGGAAETFSDIKNFCPDSVVKTGYAIYERSVKPSEMENWINGEA